MKKKTAYILFLLFIGLPFAAKNTTIAAPVVVVDTVSRYSKFVLPTEDQEACSNHLPQMWRDKVMDHSDTYYDTATYTRLIQHQPLPTPVLRDTTVSDTLVVVDTIYSVEFTVYPTFSIERKLELRKGSRVEIRGKWYDQPGNYTDTIPSTTGCDSILYITIIWAENFRQVESQIICEGNSLQWHGQTLSKEGIYWDSLTTSLGYDSVFQLYLYLHHAYKQYDTATVCLNEIKSFRWHNKTFTKGGDYYRTYIDTNNCDSTYYLHLITPTPSPDTTFTTYFCRNQGFDWRGFKYFNQMTFTDSLKNQAQCDSVVHFSFIPRNNDFHSDKINHNEGDSVFWRGKSYVIDSVYQDTLINQYGCDSIMELRLVRRYESNRSIIRCKGDTAMFKGEVISSNCDRNDSLLTIFGGDSIIRYHFSFTAPFYSREYITLCSNEYFEWTGHLDQEMLDMGIETPMILHEEGIYRDRHRNAAGCDSTYEIEVKHSPAYIKDSIVLICRDSNLTNPIIWYDSKGTKYEFYPYQYLDTIIRDTMRHTLPREPHEAISSVDFVPITGGCDSIFNFRFIITDRCSDIDTIPMCTGPDGEFIPIRVDGNFYYEPGLYSNKLTSSVHQELFMLDSVHNFYIWAAPSDTSYDTVRVCESRLPLEYNNGQKFYSHHSGDYTILFNNRYGCDSTVYLHIDVVPTVYSPIQVYNQFCPGDSIYVETPTGKIFRQAGEFNDTVPYAVEYEWGGCDSIIRYRIEYKQAFFHSETHYLGVDSAYQWKGHFHDTIYTTSGVYYDSCKNQFKCDSVYMLRLIYAQPFYKKEDKHLCTNELPYMWHTQSINKPGIYFDSLYTVYKLDSVYQLNVTIDSVYHDTIIKNFCQGDYFELDGQKITKSGRYSTTHQSEYACDSVITYVVNFNSTTFTTTEVKYIATGSSILWRGKTLHTTGYYIDTIKTTRILDGGHTCDSVYHSLQLYVKDPFYSESSLSVCANKMPLIWHNKTINQAGVHWDSCKCTNGLDSVYKLTVYVNPSYSDTIHKDFCSGDEFILNHKHYTSSGLYKDTLSSQCGCDSIVNYIIRFASASTSFRETQRCEEGQSVTWHGQTCSTGGLYYDTLRNAWGCDSIYYSMFLIVEHPFYQYDSIALCQRDFPYRWHNRDLQTAGVYWDSCTTHYGLDSIYKLRIDTLPSSFYSYNHWMCKGSSYNFGTQTITEPGVYVNHLFKENGCDSTIRCIVNYAQQYFYDEVISFVDDSELPVLWHGKTLDHEGYYFDSLTTAIYGCDSIHRVYLKKSKSYFFSEEQTLCDSRLPYLWQGQTLTSEGVYTAHYTTMEGRDSIYQLTLNVNPSDSTIINEHICPGSPYSLYGKTYDKPGIYRDTMYTPEGCYDITVLRLSLYEVTSSEIRHELCPGDTLYINGKAITKSGTYCDTTKSHVTSCDSIIRHIVAYHTAFYQNESKTINPGATYIWHKNNHEWPLTEQGTYFDSCTNMFGCDSIYRLELTVNQLEYHFPTEHVTVCESQLPYPWHNTNFYNDTVATAAYKTRLGLDSIYTLDLHVSRARDSVVYLTYCEGAAGEVKINGKVYTRSSQVTDTLTDSNGCDSLRIHYNIKFFPRYSLTQFIELKYGETYQFGDTIIATSGLYYRHFTTVNGCDSLVTLKVQACATSKDTTVRYDLCDGETLTINGQVITSAGTYISYFKTSDGCDSIVTTIINIHPTSSSYRAVSICRGDSYTWTGHWNDTILTQAGVYVDSIPTEAGCYNIYTLKLSYKNQDWADTVISLCEDKLPYIYKGKKYFADTIFLDTLGNNMEGCDSILRWHYQINQHCSPFDKFNRCTNEILEIDRQIITQAGVYQVDHITSQGEDSIYRFIVNDVQPYEVYHRMGPACDSLVHQGKTYLARSDSPTFEILMMHKTVDGCDSIEHAQMTIYTSSQPYLETATITDYESYKFDGIEYRAPGLYQRSYTNSHGCDSIRSLQLTVLTTTYTEPLTYSFCQGDAATFEIFGKIIHPTKDTILYDTVRHGGIEPVINTAVIYMQKPFKIARFIAPDTFLCAESQLEFPVPYVLEDPTATPDYYDVDWLTSEPYVAPLHASYAVKDPAQITIYLNGSGATLDPGYYTYQVTFHSEVCATRSVHQGQVEVRYPADVMKSKWDNTVTLLNADHNAGHWSLIPPYAWLVNDPAGNDKTGLIDFNNNKPYLVSNNLKDGDEVVAVLYREGYAKAVKSCPFIFQSKPASSQNPVVVYPTVVKKYAAVHVETPQQGTWKIINSTGDEYTHGTLVDGDNQIAVPGAGGYYLLQVTLSNGNKHIERIIIY